VDWSELSASLDEESARRYIAMTFHTEDAEAEKLICSSLMRSNRQVKPRQFKLAHCIRASTPSEIVEIFVTKSSIVIQSVMSSSFALRTVPLETENPDSRSIAKLSGSLPSVPGEEKTLVQMTAIWKKRIGFAQEAWQWLPTADCRKGEVRRDFRALVQLRSKSHGTQVLINYRDLCLPQDGAVRLFTRRLPPFHEAVEAEVMPVCANFRPNGAGSLGSEPAPLGFGLDR